MRWQRLAAVAAQQHGVVALPQLLELGFSRTTISRLATERAWARPHAGVYVLPGSSRSFAQRVVAAQLALPVPSVVTGAAAAHLYGVRPAPDVIHLLVGEHDRPMAPEGTYLTRTRTLLRSEITGLDGITLATGARMVIDYAAHHQPSEVRSLLIDARQRRLVDLDRLEQRLQNIGPVRGRGMMKRLVREQRAVQSDSMFEDTLRGLIDRSGLPAPAPHPWPAQCGPRVLHIDIAWPERMVGIEADGFAFHQTRTDLERDHRRLNDLALAGWTILRVGWERIERDPDGFTDELRLVLSRKLEDLAQIRATSSNSGGLGVVR